MAGFHAVIRGLVQGVGFRYFVQRAANRLGVRGWVRNRSDGGVEVEAVGDRASLERFLQELQTGPTFARVDDIELEWLATQPEYDSFRITY
ncbi:MAG: hypothetical protein Kow0059_04240 [Candidatus Sumerlaeia bacterium]